MNIIPKRKKLIFAVQHHKAHQDHYDFRLELDGVLISWAIPKGPSYNPQDKRLAIKVDDHPLSYRYFEGIIPKGNYGAGTVMLWDKGYWIPLGNPKEDLNKGILKFTLLGKRLKGKWILYHFKDTSWFLIKDKDKFKEFDNINELNTSIKTNLTMNEIANKKPIK